MAGDDRRRYCSHCRLCVYNLSAMDAAEAESLLRTETGRLCVRYYQRGDRKVMTRDCPKGLMAARMRVARTAAIAAGITLSAFGLGVQQEVAKQGSPSWADAMIDRGRSVPIVDKLVDRLFPQPPAELLGALPAAPP